MNTLTIKIVTVFGIALLVLGMAVMTKGTDPVSADFKVRQDVLLLTVMTMAPSWFLAGPNWKS